MIFLADLSVYLMITIAPYGYFKQDSIWSNDQLEYFFITFLIPLFVSSIISSVAFSNLWDGKDTVRQIKKVVSYTCLIGLIITSAVYGATAPKVSTMMLSYKGLNGSLNILEVNSKGLLTNCTYATRPVFCKDLRFDNEDYRKEMKPDVGYVNPDVNIDKLNNQMFYDISSVNDWHRDAPPYMRDENITCKSCSSFAYACKWIAGKVNHLTDCKGIYTMKYHRSVFHIIKW